MNEIKCPKCGEVFTIDEASYASIVKQVRDNEFNAEIRSRELDFGRDKENALRIAKAESDKVLQEQLSKKDSLIQELRSRLGLFHRPIQHFFPELTQFCIQVLHLREEKLASRMKNSSLLIHTI